jgi:alanyl-tRNA synthetase
MQSREIRNQFFDFFKKHRHTKVPSSSLVPAQDPTLLFINAGMNQFKDVFLGTETRSYSRAVTIQKCMRAGGKDSDLENVGRTNRHLTFFEMMGNFSFGDFFKEKAITLSWDFLTKQMKLPAEHLYVSVYLDDDEAYDIWKNVIQLPEERIIRLGKSENFWQMGDTGPCGPSSEIHLDRGPQNEADKHVKVGDDTDRFLEIWNLVFMQFDMQPDGSLQPLAQKSIDTGMGIERLSSIMQNTESVFETDLFTGIIEKIEAITGISYATAQGEQLSAFRVLADHIRSCCFSIADGITPANDGRGYVLRKIIRRATLFAQKLTEKNIFAELADPLIAKMDDIYPELQANRDFIVELLTQETEKFRETLEQGQQIFESYIKKSPNKTISGEDAFKLYDTYGFPVDLTQMLAKEHGYDVDIAGFEKAMEQQRQQSGKKAVYGDDQAHVGSSLATEFTGYREFQTRSQITGIIVDNAPQETVTAGQTCWIITDQSPFYVESGGQVSDTGVLFFAQGRADVGQVKHIGKTTAHKIHSPHDLSVGDEILLSVNKEHRLDATKNHTATHLLQAALKHFLGEHVKQSGSLVNSDYLRFDFTYHKTVTDEQIKAIEDMVNAKIMENVPLATERTTYQTAIDKGVTAIFGEKYNPEDVRIVDIPGFSAELCGGTHVTATGDIGCFKITSVTALSAGNRRATAVTGPAALATFQESYDIVKTVSQQFKTQPAELIDAIQEQQDKLKTTQQEAKKLRQQIYNLKISEWIAQVETINNIPFGYITIDIASGTELRDIGNQLMQKKPAFYFLESKTDGKSAFFAAMPKSMTEQVDLKTFASWLKEHGYKGGGSATQLQGGAQQSETQIQQKIKTWIKG